MAQYIPPIIHYSWFGGKEKPEFIRKCIATWKEKFPDYEIKEWNEQNFDLEGHPFAREAYEAGKYAFVSDYVRVFAIYHYGGIYFDTDIEVLKNFADKLKDARFVIAFELPDALMTGFFAAERHNQTVKEILDYYDRVSFYEEDGTMRMTPNPVIFTEKVTGYGLALNGKFQELEGGVRVFPNEVFGAYNVYDMVYTITDNTVLVHHYTASWRSWKEKALLTVRKTVQKVFGMNTFRFLRRMKQRVYKKSK